MRQSWPRKLRFARCSATDAVSCVRARWRVIAGAFGMPAVWKWVFGAGPDGPDAGFPAAGMVSEGCWSAPRRSFLPFSGLAGGSVGGVGRVRRVRNR